MTPEKGRTCQLGEDGRGEIGKVERTGDERSELPTRSRLASRGSTDDLGLGVNVLEKGVVVSIWRARERMGRGRARRRTM